MRIGIVGAGMIGGTLARRLTALGHEVRIANARGPETLTELAEETGAEAATVPEAIDGADLAIVTIPLRRVEELPREAFAKLAEEVPVVDTCNYYPRERDGRIAAIEEGMPESRWVEERIDHPTVKAFNTIYFTHLLEGGRSAGDPERIALPVAGDDAAAKAMVMALIDELGFDPVDAGGLGESWRQQPGAPCYTADLDAGRLRRALAEAEPERPDAFRATPESPGTFDDPR